LPVLAEMPDRVLLEIVHSLTWWIRQTVKEGMVEKRASILYLADRILNLTFTEDGDEPENNDSQLLNRAINHPVGQIVEVLLDIWFQTKPSDGDLLPGDLEPVFTEICDNSNSVYRLGRVLLASRLISLYRVDRVWTEKHLLPLFEWRRSTIEAKAVWEGFLWSPRIYWPLLIAFKDEFLLTASHYSELGDNARQYVALLTYVSLEPPDGFSVSDLRAAVGSLPKQGLEAAAKVLSQALESAGSQSSDYWQNRVQPFWRKVWPKSADLQSQAISEALALACVAAEAAFPSAFEVLRGWLGPIEHPHYVVHKLHQSNLSELYPEQTLAFLDLIIEDQSWAPAELRQCLDAIAQSGKDLLSDRRYQRLSEYVRKNAR
jgi:hypothetical protein